MKFAKRDYLPYLNDIARDAAKERVKIVENELQIAPRLEDEDKYYKAYVQQLAKRYPYSESDEFFKRFTTLKNTPSSNIARWLMGGGGGSTNEDYNPDNLAKKAEDEKFLPLLAGIAEPGKDWLSTGGEALRDKAASKEYGYSRDEFPEFLNKLAKYQTEYDRAKLLQKAKEEEGAKYVLGKLLSPSYMQEAENAILTGEGGDPETLERLRTIDYLANVGTALAPSVNIARSPYISGLVAASMQGGAEAWRQKQKEDYSTTGQKFEWTPVLGGVAAGATVPGMVGTVQQIAGRIPGESARAFSRGVMKSSKYGDPVLNERNALVKLFNDVNGFPQEQAQSVGKVNELFDRMSNIIKNNNNDPKIIRNVEDIFVANGYPREKAEAIVKDMINNPKMDAIYDLSELTELEKVPQAEKVIDFLGNNLRDENGKILVDKAMEAYDQPFAAVVRRTENGFERLPRSQFGKRPYLTSRNAKEGARLLMKEDLEDFQRLLPAKYEYLITKNAWRKAGEAVGGGLSTLGGRVEPVIKVNPFNIKDDGSNDYKSQPWYRKLDKASKKLLDDAFKKKEEE